MIVLKKDERWKHFQSANTYVSFQKYFLSNIQFKPCVNEDVVKSFELVRELVSHSYFKYEFLDAATTLSYLRFEMALKIRYKEIWNVDWSYKKSLSDLIDWFFDKGYFEARNKKFLDHYRHIRNMEAHPKAYSLGGIAILRGIYNTVDLINDLYEDVSLRKERRELMDKTNFSLDFLKQGAKMTYETHYILIYGARCVFINNKRNLPDYYIGLLPVFELGDTDGSVANPKDLLLTFVTQQISHSENGFAFTDSISKTKIEVSVLSPEQEKDINRWKESLENDSNLRLHSWTQISEIEEYFELLRRAFLKE